MFLQCDPGTCLYPKAPSSIILKSGIKITPEVLSLKTSVHASRVYKCTGLSGHARTGSSSGSIHHFGVDWDPMARFMDHGTHLYGESTFVRFCAYKRSDMRRVGCCDNSVRSNAVPDILLLYAIGMLYLVWCLF